MEDHAIIVSTFSQLGEVLARLLGTRADERDPGEAKVSDPTYSRCMIPIQFELNVSHAGFEDDGLHR